MISRRAPRRATPQESLKQFALNNSKGIDVTKPPTASDTVLEAVNMVPNLDGSFTIRKPVVCKENSFVTGKEISTKYAYLFDNSTIIAYNGKAMWFPEGFTFNFIYYDYAGKQHSIENYKSIDLEALTNGVGEVEVVNTSTTSIITGLSFNIGADVDGNDLFYSSVYDEDFKPYRYLKIFKENDSWTIELMNPELNTLTTSEDGSLAFDVNLTLDNPYALRDVYTPNAPTLKGILAYVDTSDTLKDYAKVYKASKEVTLYTSQTVKSWNVSLDLKNYTGADSVYTAQFTASLEHTVKDNVHIIHVSNLRSIVDLPKVVVFWNLQFYNDILCKDLNEALTSTVFAKNSEMSYMTENGESSSLYLTVEGTLQLKISVEVYAYPSVNFNVKYVTENVQNKGFKILSRVDPKNPPSNVRLKAFGQLPTKNEYYACWFRTVDGVAWEACPTAAVENYPPILVRDPIKVSNNNSDDSEEYEYESNWYYRLISNNEFDRLYGSSSQAPRIDVYNLNDSESDLKYTYMFKVISVRLLNSSDGIYDKTLGGVQYTVNAELGRRVYTFPTSNTTEYAVWEAGSPVSGSHVYYFKKLFSYGNPKFENLVYSTEPGSFITPLSYLSDVNVGSSSVVTTISPWRSYLFAATESSISLIMPQEIGWTSKVLSTSVGVPKEDSNCCLPGLNGIIFKSNDKVFMAYPNTYSGDDTNIYVTDMSKPVEHILSRFPGNGTQFAFATNSEYILMLPDTQNDMTHCLRYSYDLKIWTYCTYPVIVKSYKIFSLTNIVLFAEKEGTQYELEFDAVPKQDWVDFIDDSQPIEFELDTGMKTDNISMQKQFVESKFIFATEDDIEMFPVELTVAIDGDPHITHLDVNSDSPFWKDHKFSRGVVGTSFRLSNDESLGRSSSGIFRQLVVRYSGKGRSIRHILRGASQSNFRLYETYVRYKTLNVKK